MAEGCSGGTVKQVGHVAPLAGVSELDQHLVGHAVGGHVKGLVDVGRQLGEEIVVHEPFGICTCRCLETGGVRRNRQSFGSAEDVVAEKRRCQRCRPGG